MEDLIEDLPDAGDGGRDAGVARDQEGGWCARLLKFFFFDKRGEFFLPRDCSNIYRVYKTLLHRSLV